MKKIILLCLLTLFTALVFVSGCAKIPNKEVLIYTVYPAYNNIDEIIQSAELIMKGNIISSQVVMLDTTEPITEDQKNDPQMNPGGETNSLSLPYTVYEVEIQQIYKGKVVEGNTIEFKQLGGTVGNIHYTEEDAMNIEVGSTYILFLETYSNSPASLINQVQGIYEYKDNKIIGNSKNTIILDLKDLE
jgi:hypothetical protein